MVLKIARPSFEESLVLYVYSLKDERRRETHIYQAMQEGTENCNLSFQTVIKFSIIRSRTERAYVLKDNMHTKITVA